MQGGAKPHGQLISQKIMLLTEDISKKGEIPHSDEVYFILSQILTVKTMIQRFSAILDKGKSS